MPNRLSRLLASAVLVCALGIAQQTLSDADHFGVVARENDPAKKLMLLDQWTAGIRNRLQTAAESALHFRLLKAGG